MTPSPSPSGVVVASHPAAAAAGASALAAGGNAVDAAVATAFALTVVEPAQCGLAGYGGFLTYAPPDGDPFVVDFNTWVPAYFDPDELGAPGAGGALLDGGPSVAPPMTVPGLVAARAAFGRLPLVELVAPAVRLAREGFALHHDLARALRDHWERTRGGTDEFAALYYPGGSPPALGSPVVQPELADTLAGLDDDAFRRGPLAEATCEAVARAGGRLEPDDLAADRVVVGPAESASFERLRVSGPRARTSGTGILFGALRNLEPASLGLNRARSYVDGLAAALRLAWAERARESVGDLNASGTTHLCTADADGGVASLSFTHGRRRFGSGVVIPGTGVILNGGVNLFARSSEGPVAMTNMAPVVLHDESGMRHAVGAVGGPRIPAIVLSTVVDVAHYGMSLPEALAAPHLSVRTEDGVLEAEPELLETSGGGESWSTLKVGETFGPATGLSVSPLGAEPAADPRFAQGVAFPG
jgi:gamma-glutamyltranspeptidase / glutathione hydrolase